jgi:hypothetical protein
MSHVSKANGQEVRFNEAPNPTPEARVLPETPRCQTHSSAPDLRTRLRLGRQQNLAPPTAPGRGTKAAPTLEEHICDRFNGLTP